MIAICYNKFNRLASHEGLGSAVDLPLVFAWETSQGGRCLPMGIVSALTLMISFGTLIALIMSDKNHKK
ncbi:putative holin-like toxin [Lentibacillus sp. L22]|uniref:putative holin-like toxin n=1 Tax=Lentibacillus sp. L22 TaxID=3163028 RepID=UPI003467AAE9